MVGTPLKLVTTDAIEAHYTALIEQRGILPTVRKLNTLLRCCFKRAVRKNHLAQSPCEYLDPLPTVHPKGKPPMPLESFEAFVTAALEEERNAVWYLLLLATGMRPEESFALKWTDLDGRNILIERALVRPCRQVPGEPKWTFGPTKNKKKRTVKVDPQLVLLLRAHKAQQNEDKLLAGSAYVDHGLIFADKLGAPLWESTMGFQFKEVLKRAGLPENLSPYSCRKGAATALLRKGKNLKVVSELLGSGIGIIAMHSPTSRQTCSRRRRT